MGKIIPNIPNWKYLYSYLYETPIDSYKNEINGRLDLSLKKGRLMLCADNAIYSYDDYYFNFRDSFDRLGDERMSKINSVLVLGMGLGSIPLILEKDYNNSFDFTLVEYDEDIAYLANLYTIPRLESSVSVLINDAEIFVQVAQEKYDLICVDLYQDHLVPDQFKSIDFLMNCKNLLTDNGLLIFNAPGNTEEEENQSITFADEVFIEVFPEGKYCHLFKNCMLFSK